MARRSRLSTPEKKRAKAEYDRKRRERLGDVLLKKKRDAYYRDHERHLEKQRVVREAIHADPAKLAAHRAEMAKYRANPKWKVHKKEYDRRFRAVAMFGEEYADAYLALLELDSEINEMVPDRGDIYGMKGTRNKAQMRKREYACRKKTLTLST